MTEMRKYELLHKLEKYTNYRNSINNKSKNDKRDLANHIFKNYDTMDETEMRIMATKCLDANDFKKTLLLFELKHYKSNVKESITLNDFKIVAFNVFRRYQCKAGGFCIEDNEWTVYDSKTTKYDVNENEIVFENTINLVDVYDTESDEFLIYLVKRLGSIAKNIKVSLRQKHHKKSKVMTLLIWALDKNQVVQPKSSIGL
jgi:hypothetical protein